jgi:two-component system, NtrC family, nitrogen regulation response regulator GlnG
MPVLLVIDDEPLILECFRYAFAEPNMTLVTAGTAAEGLSQFSKHRPDVVILDVHLPDMSGLDAFQRLHQIDAKVPIIFITGHGTAETAIEAMRLGAYEYVLKPLDPDQLTELVNRAFKISRLMRVPAVVSQADAAPDSSDLLVGSCSAMQEVYKAIGRVAGHDVTVLIRGESGTGKELVARAIYHYSRRSAGSFLAVNCAAIPENLLESELFGHEKGSFTGADRKRIGKFEQCVGGTLLLDEIGDMTLMTQAKILRVLQDQKFERVGGNETITTNVRIIAATNRNLESMVAAHQFRDDLLYRLNVFTIKVPPLRERQDDIPALVEHFLKQFGRELNKRVQQITPDALELLRNYAWPGNIRELQSVLKQALLQASGTVLVPDFLPSFLTTGVKTPTPTAEAKPVSPTESVDWTHFIHDRLKADSTDLYAEWQALTDRHLLSQVLRHTHGNQSQAARILGITRSTLRTKLTALGLAADEAAGEHERASP